MFSLLTREAVITMKIISSNAFVTISPGVSMAALAWFVSNAYVIPSAYTYNLPTSFLITVVKSLVYFFFYLYTFDLDNQIMGIEEDRLNKPNRPIVTGLLSVRGAHIRHILSTVAFIVLGIIWNTAIYAVGWVALTLIYNHSQMSKNWISKNNIFLWIAIILLLAPGWQLVCDIPVPIGRWIVFIALLWAVPGHSQDMRDIEGDLKVGRNTLPIVFGMEMARNILVITYCLVCPTLFTYYMVFFHSPLFHSDILIFYIWYLINLMWFGYIGLRFKYLTTKHDDHMSYMFHCGYLLFSCLSTPLLILMKTD